MIRSNVKIFFIFLIIKYNAAYIINSVFRNSENYISLFYLLG